MFVWGYISVTSGWYPPWRHPLDVTQHLCFQATFKHSIALKLFLVHYHVSLMKGWCFIHRRWNNVTISESRTTSHANITEPQAQEEQTQHWWNIEEIWASVLKNRAKIKIQEQFSVSVTSQTSLHMNMSRDVSPTCVSVWLFKYRRSLVFFQPEV